MLLQAAAPLPGVGRHDERAPVDVRVPPWSGVLRVFVPGVSGCTAILLAPRLALTAAHCVWIERTGQFVRPGVVHVLAGYDRESFVALTTATHYRIAAGWDPNRRDATRGHDAALLTLAAPLGGAGQVLPLLQGWPPPGANVAVAGFNQDHSQQVEADLGCHVIEETTSLIRHDCDATLGTSGGPLLVRGTDGTWRVAGMQVGALAEGGGGVAVPAVALQALLSSEDAAR